jgi:nitroreductase
MGAENRLITDRAVAAGERVATRPVAPLFINRWSPRAFAGEPISDDTLFNLFEAARWAPSAFNSQPWRFVYAKRDSTAWPKLLALLIPYNQAWASAAAALVFVVSKTTFTPPGKSEPAVSRSASFDTGAAWASLAFQAFLDGWATHAMGGFDDEAARVTLSVPADHRIEAVVAIGRRGDKAALPERYRAGETPNSRRPIAEAVFEGAFPSAL